MLSSYAKTLSRRGQLSSSRVARSSSLEISATQYPLEIVYTVMCAGVLLSLNARLQPAVVNAQTW